LVLLFHRHPRQGQAALQGHHQQQALPAHCTESAQPWVHGDRARQGLGGRHHVHLHRRGLAVPGDPVGGRL